MFAIATMSNSVVGGVYQMIMEKVIQASHNDFEESGVDQVTLDEMKQGWQERLSSLKIAHFPWDPAPEPPRQPPTVPSNVKADNEMPPMSGSQEPNFPNVPVKVEGGYQQPIANYPQAQPANNGYTGYEQNNELARQRAAALVQQRVHQQGNGHQQNFPNLAQQADDFMRARVDAMAMRQDSGLMVPLDSMPKGKKRKAAVRVLQAQDAEASSSVPMPARFDGDDEVKPEEDPDDAINSDLDDSEDELGEGENSDDDMVDYMLCTYDKVQRVKNKWKCTLKDGILTTNKKEHMSIERNPGMPIQQTDSSTHPDHHLREPLRLGSNMDSGHQIGYHRLTQLAHNFQ
ncbi:transcription factor IIA alpha beta subunit [Pyrenophora seminiperda CCB06]|uniref:Transcription factor IIA alpha beta subunit n=1 Tax=Pyrenophora seminiperda CCB06 TaxID=1302712 RepID=A0A3M7LYY2_9PLEO|nr:transcription factor IIA alpha beta subunit [Pyrenophora seminiperda CCB06]